MSINVGDKVRTISDGGKSVSMDIATVINIHRIPTGDIAIIAFPDRVVKVHISDLFKEAQHDTPNAEIDSEIPETERTITEEVFAETAVELIGELSRGNITLMMGYTQFVAELHKALFGENERS